ncbi:hypothetical protein ACYZUA_10100 [Pseudomonas sp. LS2P72]
MNSPMTNADPASNQQIVVFPPDRGIGVLAVVPPYPVGFKPQSDGALGININMVHGDRDGLLVYILAYLNMAIGDNIKVYIETKNAPVADFSVTDAHFDAEGNAKNIPFYISTKDMEARFLPPENKDFWFEVQRVSGNPSEGSPPVQMFYKHPAPGEADTDGGKPFNQGLKLPIASESVVDQTVIDDGMFVTVLEYFNQSIGDVVVLAFGSLLLETTVTALGDVVFELIPDELATLAPTNSLVVRWEVFDVVENASGWSDALILTFKPGVVLLTAPIFELADLDNVVHHDWLLGGTMPILVTGVFAANDVVVLLLKGFTEGGDPVSHIYTQTLTVASRTLNFPVENHRVQNVIRGSLRATYELTRAGKTQCSKPADITITGGAFKLGLPTVSPLENDTLPVDTVTATAQFADYWPLKEGALVQLLWQTTDDAGIAVLIILQQVVTDPTLPIVFTVEAKYIAPHPSAPLTVQCAITNPEEVRVVSDLLRLQIGDEKAIELAPPTLVGVQGPIDPLGEDRTIRVEYPARIAGDQARLVQMRAPAAPPPFDLTTLNQNNRANWVLDVRFRVANQGTRIQKRWNLRRDGKKVASSPGAYFEIAPIAPGDSRLPTPRISGVSGVLEVNKLTAANLLEVDPWPGQTQGQAKFLIFEGTHKNGTTVSYQALEGELTGAEQGSRTALFLAWLIELKDETELHIVFSVRLGQGQEPLPFPTQTYLVESLVELQPVITSLQDPQEREVTQGSETVATTITVYGHGSDNEQIQILVNGVVVETVRTDASGNFVQAVTAEVYDDSNTIQLRALYGSNYSSPTRSYILRRPLQIPTHQMNLHGYRVYTGWRTTGRDFPGNTETRTAQNGVGTRRFSSSNTGVATVDANGKVTGLRNGVAWIYVQDQFTTLEFYVSVANVYTLVKLGYGLDVAASVRWMNSVPGSQSVVHAFSAMQQVYGPEDNWQLSPRDAWGMCYPAACPAGYNYAFSWRNGGLNCGRDHQTYLYSPWCLRPY